MTGAADLLERITDLGLGANVNYPPVYALGVYLRLLSRLAERSRGTTLTRRATTARNALHVDLERARQARVITAQHAAFVITACLEAGQPGQVDPRWLTLVLRQQRFDGSWIGEPVFAAPNRGRSVTWYSSTILTTAFCYDALMQVLRGAPQGPQ